MVKNLFSALSLVAIVLFGAVGFAQSEPPRPPSLGPLSTEAGVDSALGRCFALLSEGERAPRVITRLGPTRNVVALHVAGGLARRAWLVFIWWEGQRSRCEAIAIERAVARTWGELMPGRGRVKAYVMDDASSPLSALVVRTEEGLVLHAELVRGCSAGMELNTVALFPGQDALSRTCLRASGGKAVRVERALLNWAKDEGFQQLVSVDAGLGEVLSEGEPRCFGLPPGRVEVVSAGIVPVIEVWSPLDVSTPGVIELSQRRWSARLRRFVKERILLNGPRPMQRRCF